MHTNTHTERHIYIYTNCLWRNSDACVVGLLTCVLQRSSPPVYHANRKLAFLYGLLRNGAESCDRIGCVAVAEKSERQREEDRGI